MKGWGRDINVASLGALITLAIMFGADACTHYVPVPAVTPGTIAAADEALRLIDEFQTLVIDSATQGELPLPTARIFVRWTVASAKIIGQLPQGWPTVLRQTWPLIRGEVEKVPQLLPWVATIDALIGGI